MEFGLFSPFLSFPSSVFGLSPPPNSLHRIGSIKKPVLLYVIAAKDLQQQQKKKNLLQATYRKGLAVIATLELFFLFYF